MQDRYSLCSTSHIPRDSNIIPSTIGVVSFYTASLLFYDFETQAIQLSKSSVVLSSPPGKTKTSGGCLHSFKTIRLSRDETQYFIERSRDTAEFVRFKTSYVNKAGHKAGQIAGC
ncbi:hypothetical protein KIL84_010723 [Mauremys mutica]|uniref:Uncharacterized protein n=1 Tax=Mauremys mutica TaxID=74926 RepID=A0A9D3XC82_9SAUR|nr:hypothetical protein KIL84_010723 [Mauremys mutica]